MALTPLMDELVTRLMEAGTWVPRAQLEAGLSSTCTPAIDDALADLVVEGYATFAEHAGYRLAGTPLARRAAWKLRAEGLTRAVEAEPHKGHYRIGVAEVASPEGQGKGLHLVMYELSMPLPAEGPDQLTQHLAQVQAIDNFASRGI
ncbi:hypothetical protein [Variovorax sp. HJSM1_2]|uniref:hypothetical protein n=1 Tax=Variovorax sp. HJSM1_2 TaxID=3366263 RepID=UPI003BBA9DC0